MKQKVKNPIRSILEHKAKLQSATRIFRMEMKVIREENRKRQLTTVE